MKPLVLDVDGTFLKTDLLYETFWAGLGRDPAGVLRAVARGRGNRAALKAELAQAAPLRSDLLPVHPKIKELATESARAGRPVVLASASDESLVQGVAAAHGFEGRVFASDGGLNLRGEYKAEALVAAYGERGFDYAGNAAVDRPVWARADTALVVGPEALAEPGLRPGQQVIAFDGGWSRRDLFRALRPHQWVKNVLLLLPVVAAHTFALPTLALVLLGILAFSAAASTIYIVNDLLDLEADRLHPQKKYRPFARGAVPIPIGMIAAGALGLTALAVAALLGGAFLGVIVLYMLLSLAYSLRLKKMRWVDIATLASLYTLRVVGGAAATGVDASTHMLIFVFPVFIALGCVKRLTELTLATSDARLPGRGYGRSDRGDLLNVAGIGTVAALLIFFLYSFSDQAQALYPTQWILWVALIPLAFWLIRMVVLGYLGKQDYDPIVFAMTDKFGIGLILITLSMMFYAAGLWAQWFGL